MKNYTMQSYFKSLCKTYCIALNERKRIQKEKNIEYWEPELDELWWEKELRVLSDNIYRTIQMIRDEDFKIIISSKEEVMVLIYAFAKVFEIENYKIINDAPEFVKILEGDPMCDVFFMAYRSNDNKIMEELKAIYHE